jgi:hypothetical protein
LFGLTLICVGGFYFTRVIREYFRSKPFVAFEKKAASAIQAADMGWVALVCGPLVAAPTVPRSAILAQPGLAT